MTCYVSDDTDTNDMSLLRILPDECQKSPTRVRVGVDVRDLMAYPRIIPWLISVLIRAVTHAYPEPDESSPLPPIPIP